MPSRRNAWMGWHPWLAEPGSLCKHHVEKAVVQIILQPDGTSKESGSITRLSRWTQTRLCPPVSVDELLCRQAGRGAFHQKHFFGGLVHFIGFQYFLFLIFQFFICKMGILKIITGIRCPDMQKRISCARYITTPLDLPTPSFFSPLGNPSVSSLLTSVWRSLNRDSTSRLT